MIVSLFNKQIQEEGYLAFRTEIPEITYAVKKESGCFNVVRIINCKKDFSLSNEQYVSQKQEITNTLSKSGEGNVHIMTLVFFEDMKNAFEIVGDDYMCWFIDKVSNQLLLNNNRIEDFYGLKDQLNAFLSKYKGFVESGNIQAIDNLSHNEVEKKKKEKIRNKKPIPVTILLISVNITVFLTYLLIGEPFVDSGCMNPVRIDAGEYYRFITSIFLHADVNHIFSNMILLYFLGEVIESKLGSFKFAILYFLSGISGDVVSYFYSKNVGGYTSIGASGAVYGLIGVFVIMAIKKYKGMDIPKKRLILMLVYSVYSSFDAHVDFAAHLGGLAVGIILGILMITLGGRKNES